MKSFTVKYNLQRDIHYIFKYFNTRHLSRMFHEGLARLQKMLGDTKTMKKTPKQNVPKLNHVQTERNTLKELR